MQCLLASEQAQSQKFVEVESIVRKYSKKHTNIYSLVEFACCRDTTYKPNNPQEEETKEETKIGASKKEQKIKLINFTFLFGCRPTTGVQTCSPSG